MLQAQAIYYLFAYYWIMTSQQVSFKHSSELIVMVLFGPCQLNFHFNATIVKQPTATM